MWHWILEQKDLNLQNLEINISKIGNLIFLDSENVYNEEVLDLNNLLDDEDINIISDIYENSLQDDNQNNEFQQYHWKYTFNNQIFLQIFEVDTNNYVLYFSLINLKLSTVKFNSSSNNIHNPVFNVNLQQYLKNTWWKTLVLWGNVVTQIKERSRRTTATIEVENKIIKHYDIKQRNLDLDKYLYERTSTLKANQLLVADKLINNK